MGHKKSSSKKRIILVRSVFLLSTPTTTNQVFGYLIFFRVCLSSHHCFDKLSSECWESVHKRGVRKSHRWEGFRAGSPACVACRRSPAERKCNVCNDLLCVACFKERLVWCGRDTSVANTCCFYSLEFSAFEKVVCLRCSDSIHCQASDDNSDGVPTVHIFLAICCCCCCGGGGGGFECSV